MSHLEDNQEYVRMSMDNDYAGGTYADGEFSMGEQQQGHVQTKEEAIYGVFGNEYTQDQRRQNARSGLGKKAMNFVSSGAPASLSGMKDEEKKEEEKSEPEAPPPPPPKRKPRPAGMVMDRDFGKFEKHTKGFGMRMLMKMGFRENNGRLGKTGTGIVNPVHSKLRPKGMGIAFNNYKEVSDKEHYRNAEEEEKAANSKKKVVVQERVSREANWRKGGAKKKVVYKTASDVRKEEAGMQEMSLKNQVIIDMRGPTVKMTSLDQISSVEVSDPLGWAPTRSCHNLPELQYNIRLLVDLAKEDIQKLDREMKHAENTVLALSREQGKMQETVDEEKREIGRTEEMMALVKKCDERVKKIAATTKSVPARIETICDVMELIHDTYAMQWKSFEVALLLDGMVSPLLRALCHSWLPMQMNDQKAKQENGREPTIDIFSILERLRLLLRDDSGIYRRMLQDAVMPKVTIAISSEWRARDFVPAIHLMRRLKLVLPVEMHVKIFTTMIIPKLKREVEQWNPRVDRTPIHSWLHPWLDVVSHNDMQPVHQVIRYKLAVVLQEWDPSDGSAFQVIEPWHGVFLSSDFESLLARCVLPKLHTLLRTKFTVNPQRQYVEPFKWVVRWEALIPARVMLQLLRMEFFPKWFTALHTWLMNTPNFEEVQQWYMGWKALLPESLQRNDHMKMIFNRALDLMNQALADPSGIGKLMETILIELKSDRIGKAPGKAKTEPKKPEARQTHRGEATDMSFKDIMHQFADVHGIMFMPNAKRGTHDGKQIYSFGNVTVYMDNKCIFAHEVGPSGNKEWRPIALQDLLVRAQR